MAHAVPSPSDPQTIESLADACAGLRREIGKVIVGQDETVGHVIVSLLAQGHVLLVGVPGLAKTLLVRTLAEALDLSFSRIQFTPDLMPSDITGTEIIEEEQHTGKRIFRFVRGPIFANIVLADEINRTPPKTQAALLEAMQEHHVTAAGQTFHLGAPFFVLATQNPIEQEGTYPLPEAQLDRFFFKIDVPFPSVEDLVEIAVRTTGHDQPAAHPVADGATLLAMQSLARGVPIASHVIMYAARVLKATHPDQADAPQIVRRNVRFGASPRGMQAMILAAKIGALLDGRYNVAYDDIRQMALSALRHRLILNFEAGAEGITADAVIGAIVNEIKQDD
jgi:MoxR-like ATPase